MASAKMNWCRVCGKEYKVCPSCANVKSYTPWRVICDTAVHYKVWLIVEHYRKGIISKSEAQSQFLSCGVSDDEISTFIPSVKDILNDILSVAATATTSEDVISEGSNAAATAEVAAKTNSKAKNAESTTATKRKGRAK